MTSVVRMTAGALYLLAAMIFLLSRDCRAEEITFQSKPTRTHLIELYTSEGCSSCPPAEAWLSKLKDQPGLWRDFVPVAFHVDYWDYLGWRDPFASKAWTARQYQYSAGWKNSNVYTPGFVLDGREWRDHELPSASSETSGTLKVAAIDLNKVKATFQPTAAGKSLQIHVAKLGFGLSTNVKAGENSGRKLLHDFVVLSLNDAPISSGQTEVPLDAKVLAQVSDARLAIAAWITESGRSEPIQAVGGWLR